MDQSQVYAVGERVGEGFEEEEQDHRGRKHSEEDIVGGLPLVAQSALKQQVPRSLPLALLCTAFKEFGTTLLFSCLLSNAILGVVFGAYGAFYWSG